ncbi:PREDICTED: ankyrin repeat domain-containing protein 1-like [Branchiostoma belcheri]|uniref:Ankyrin repeat domain-containing protein 1-like n=1 Tax=Branchiostoma belcheri TaxID=7741 RepID=A0A6P5AKS1_BRABE|nr:PREDICTED: ankyrin repeat domain-containing protein 1-like [Branchiostoma belcheri]XP_019643676.1 PREDICTED: ankyrin repeat domain-containing protein 1-like [Branchiostoma belcheri]XP_019643677.1 PREDICTED: ankyrin repeat domain-containing protein 1-like [Branchiostoma belcheri]XP_019643678.1 PREDICTED: ankyrin repeat domain-containing protein 1-like [Branchiostoma belcheri]
MHICVDGVQPDKTSPCLGTGTGVVPDRLLCFETAMSATRTRDLNKTTVSRPVLGGQKRPQFAQNATESCRKFNSDVYSFIKDGNALLRSENRVAESENMKGIIEGRAKVKDASAPVKEDTQMRSDWKRPRFEVEKVHVYTLCCWIASSPSNVVDVDIDIEDSNPEPPSLHDAAEDGDVELVRTLVRTKLGDVNLVNKFGHTALHEAAWGGHTEICRVLVGAGARVNPSTSRPWGGGDTPVHFAAFEGHLCTLRYLAGAGADLDARNDSGETAAHNAARMGQAGVVRYLARCGADLSLRNDSGRTVHEQAVEFGHRNIGEWIHRFTRNPRPLQDLCRDVIRSCVGPTRTAEIDDTPEIPPGLTPYLKLQH